jgi:hypothetical protein
VYLAAAAKKEKFRIIILKSHKNSLYTTGFVQIITGDEDEVIFIYNNFVTYFIGWHKI